MAGQLVTDKRVGGMLAQGQSLMSGDLIWSPNVEYHLEYRRDGNLVLVKGRQEGEGDESWWAGEDVWQSKTGGTSPGKVTVQGDGGLVMTFNNSTVQSLTEMSMVPEALSGWNLVVQNNGRIVVSLNGAEEWDNI